jgi:putative peptide zinc metalloprotease protein
MLSLEALQEITGTQVFDSTEGRTSYVVVTAHGGHARLSPSAHYLLKNLQAGRSYQQLAQELSERGPREVFPEEVEAACRHVVGRLREVDDRAAGRTLPPGFWLRFRLMPSRWVAKLANRLAWAFHPVAAVLLLGFIAASFSRGLRQTLSFDLSGSASWPWLGYLLFLASLLVHELGHASACSRYGVAPSEIGFAAYLIYPVFYSDVTAAWRLRRWQRVVVDLGGTYFQLVVAGLYSALSIWSGWAPLRSACFMILIGALFSLNPVFKFDGYWILADSLGVANLSRQPSVLVRHALARLRGRPVGTLPWPGWVLTILTLYALAASLTWAWFMVRLAPFLLAKTLGVPWAALSLWASLHGVGPAWAGLADFLWTSVLLTFVWYGVWRILQSSVFTPALQWLRETRKERRSRNAAAVTAS